MSQTYRIYYVPDSLKELLPTLNRLHVYKMPAQPRLMERVVKVKHSRNRIFGVNKDGKVYSNQVRSGLHNMFGGYRSIDIPAMVALNRIGVLPGQELEVIRSFKEKIRDKSKRVSSLEYTMKRLEEDGFKIPDELFRMVEVERAKKVDFKDWKDNQVEDL